MGSEPQRQAYANGRFVPESEARISVFDSGVVFGDIAFESIRTFRHVPFRMREHVERLYASLRCLQIDCGLTPEEMEAATLRTIEVNLPCFPPAVDFLIVHNVSRGPVDYFRSAFPEGPRPTVLITCWPLTYQLAPLAPLYSSGVNIIIPSQRNIPSQYLDPKVKNRSRVHYQMANLEAARAGTDAFALLLDGDGFLSEGTASNFFLVKDGQLFTPEPRNILCGISRKTVMELAAQLAISCRECDLEPYHLVNADEAFFTSTPFCLLPATRFHSRPIGNGSPGPVTSEILAAWSRLVGLDIVAQAESYSRLLNS